MRPAPFRASLDDEPACRMVMLSAIGQHLQTRYAEQEREPVPERLRMLLQRLSAAEAGSASR
jgi:Anti-sigma factor NepR